MNLDNIINETSRILAGWSAFLSKTLMGAFGSLASLIDLYHFVEVLAAKKFIPQRKTRLATHGLGFLVNGAYTAAAIVGNIFSFLGLGIVGVASDVISLLRSSYILHSTRMQANAVKKELNDLQLQYQPHADNAAEQEERIRQLIEERNIIRETRFRYKADTVYSTMSVVASGFFIGGLFFPPLMLASIALFALSKVVQAIDTYNNYFISHALSKLFTSSNSISDVPAQDKKLDDAIEDIFNMEIEEEHSSTAKTNILLSAAPSFADENGVEIDENTPLTAEVIDDLLPANLAAPDKSIAYQLDDNLMNDNYFDVSLDANVVGSDVTTSEALRF